MEEVVSLYKKQIEKTGAEEMEFQWKFFVKDNGIGIEPDYYRRIF